MSFMNYVKAFLQRRNSYVARKTRKETDEMLEKVCLQLDKCSFAKYNDSVKWQLAQATEAMQQVFRPETHAAAVSCLRDCVHEIRNGVASAVACMLPSPAASLSPNSSLSRSALENLHKFKRSYEQFLRWLNQLSDIPITDSVGEAGPSLDSGHKLFEKMKRDIFMISLEFETICQQLQGGSKTNLTNTTDTTKNNKTNKTKHSLPVHQDDSSNANQPTSNRDIDQKRFLWSHAPPLNSEEMRHYFNSFLSVNDRSLLAELWSSSPSQQRPTQEGSSKNIPAKPPLIPAKPVGSGGITRNDTIQNLSTKRGAVQDPPATEPQDLTKYLQRLADLVRLPVCQPANRNETRSSTLPRTSRKDDSDLTFLEHLADYNIPLFDASDNDEVHENVTRPELKTQQTWLHQYPAAPQAGVDEKEGASSTSADPTTQKISPFQRTVYPDPSGAKHNTFGRSPASQTTKERHPPASTPACDLLDDSRMQDDIALATMRLRLAENTDPGGISIPGFNSAGLLSHNVNQIDIDQVNSVSSPWESKAKTDSHEDFELIELPNGKKYKRHFKRHVFVERTRFRQLIVAPALPDGSGPDLARAVLTVNEPKSIDAVIKSESAPDSVAQLPCFPASTCSSSGNGDTLNPLVGPEGATVDPSSGPDGKDDGSDSCGVYGNDDDDDDDGDDHLSTLGPSSAPSKPYFPLRSQQPAQGSSEDIETMDSNMLRFGKSEQDLGLDCHLSLNLVKYFRSHWHKQEAIAGPHSRSKTLVYMQHYGQETPLGDQVHRATCVRNTCSVNMVGGLEKLRSKDLNFNQTPENGSSVQLPDPCRPRKSELACAPPDVDLSKSTSSLGSGSSLSSEPDDQMFPVQSNPRNAILLNWNALTIKKDDCPSLTPSDLGHGNEPSMVLHDTSILAMETAENYLQFENIDSADDVSVHAGCIDALVVHLTSIGKTDASQFLFFQTFLYTYRVFMTTTDLINRLTQRFSIFQQRHARGDPDGTRICRLVISALLQVIAKLEGDYTPEVDVSLQPFRDMISNTEFDSALSALTTIREQQESYSTADSVDDDGAEAVDGAGVVVVVTAAERESSPHPEAAVGKPREVARSTSSLGSLLRHQPVECLTLKSSNQSSSCTSLSLNSHGLMSPAGKTKRKNATLTGLLSYSAVDLANQITYLGARVYEKLKIVDLLDISAIETKRVPNIKPCIEYCNAVANWTRFQLMCSSRVSDRDRYANKILEVMECLHKLQNFSGYFSCLCAFVIGSEEEMKMYTKKTRRRIRQIEPYMKPPYFKICRKELYEANPPFIPYLFFVLQDLIIFAEFNKIYLSKPPEALVGTYCPERHGRIVNFWRCWKHFNMIQFMVKQESMGPRRLRYTIQPNAEILAFLDNFSTPFQDTDSTRPTKL